MTAKYNIESYERVIRHIIMLQLHPMNLMNVAILILVLDSGMMYSVIWLIQIENDYFYCYYGNFE